MATPLPEPGVTPRIVWANMINEGILSREADAAAALAAQAAADQAAFAVKVYEKSGVELDHGENATGTTTTVPVFAAASAVVPGCLVNIPANANPVTIEYGGSFNIGVSGGGLLGFEIWDVTAGGVGTVLHAIYLGIVAAQISLFSGFAQTLIGQYLLDVSSSDRKVQMKTILYRDSGGLTAVVSNAARNSTAQPSFITAVQR